ncbi:Beta/Gamma crystallin [Seinonella peptonophila]|uniref:Beta/Gamma crystallin n=1 Tax=Seinonella peptonophila TaxID=112248 RepID=A0A1M4WA61_9BACL|nr:beta/gamma crystallin-related protein [Seinonella peptonophila]SHE78055.1 Beta/Gamma crystallin [Seinonella peptonophila]
MKRFRYLSFIVILLIGIVGSACSSKESPTVSKLKKQTIKNSSAHCVTLYENPNFTGKTMKFCQDTVYIGDEMNDLTSAAKADCGVKKFTLFEHRDYEGKSITLSGCSQVIFTDDDPFNELISSVKIQR